MDRIPRVLEMGWWQPWRATCVSLHSGTENPLPKFRQDFQPQAERHSALPSPISETLLMSLYHADSPLRSWEACLDFSFLSSLELREKSYLPTDFNPVPAWNAEIQAVTELKSLAGSFFSQQPEMRRSLLGSRQFYPSLRIANCSGYLPPTSLQ